MNNIEILKEFILRKQELLNTIKSIVLILILDETKKELIEANNEKRDCQYKKNDIITTGDDIYQQNAIDLVNLYYESNLDKLNDKIEALNSTIQSLNIKLNFNNGFPIYKEGLAYERRLTIEWIFNVILIKNNNFQNQCFEILKNIVFGELIRKNKPILLQEIERLCLTIKHLRDLKMFLGQLNKSIDEDLLGLINQLKKEFVFSGGDLSNVNKIFENEFLSIDRLLSWYGITNKEQGHIQIETVIGQRIVSSKEIINILNNENAIYSKLISNFKVNVEEWKKSWINLELPNEELF